MKISTKQILSLLILPVAVLLFSGCGQQPKAPVAPSTPVAKQQAAPVDAKNGELPPLPADSKQAIDGEIQGIDQSLQEVEASLATDTQDAELGL